MPAINTIVGGAPTDMPQRMEPPAHTVIGAATGLGFGGSYPNSSQPGARVTAESGPATGSGGSMLDVLGLGGAYANPQGFAADSNPIAGNGVNLIPTASAIKGQFDISRLDPRTWYPGVMTLFHTTRKPGASETGNMG